MLVNTVKHVTLERSMNDLIKCYVLFVNFTALRGMQTRFNDENSVRLSVS